MINHTQFLYRYRHVTPKLIPKDAANYVVGYCKCPKDSSYGLIVHKSELTDEEKSSGWCYLECDDCHGSCAVGVRGLLNEINNHSN